VRELKEYGCEVHVHDPIAAPEEALLEYGIGLSCWDQLPVADAMVAAVSHREYLSMPLDDIFDRLKQGGVFVVVKSAYRGKDIQSSGITVWRL
jgi:UDP-N-acetyl-D-galactosamine dehydrogenase